MPVTSANLNTHMGNFLDGLYGQKRITGRYSTETKCRTASWLLLIGVVITALITQIFLMVSPLNPFVGL